MEKVKFSEVRNKFSNLDRGTTAYAVVVFKEGVFEFDTGSSLDTRSFAFSSNEKIFDDSMGGYSLYASNLDRTICCSRIEGLVYDENVDYCYFVEFYPSKDNIEKLLSKYKIVMDTSNISISELLAMFEDLQYFNKVAVWPATILCEPTKEQAIFDMEFSFAELGVRIKFAEETIVVPYPPKNETGGRHDVLFYVHDEDISKFEELMESKHIEWFDDVISKGYSYMYHYTILRDYCKGGLLCEDLI